MAALLTALSPASLLALVHAIAGSAASAVALTATYPLLTLSTRAAVRDGGRSYAAEAAALCESGGVAALFAGLRPALAGVALTNAIYYFCYERLRPLLAPRPTPVRSLALAAVAGALTALLTNPLWVLSSRMQAAAADGRRPSATAALAALLRADGPRGLLRGIGPALLLVANPALQYAAFEQLRAAALRRSGRRALSGAQVFALAALAKAAATIVTYPYVMARARMHTADGPQPTAAGVLRRQWAARGLAGVYAGVQTKLLQSVLAAALLFALQERLAQALVAAALRAAAAAARRRRRRQNKARG